MLVRGRSDVIARLAALSAPIAFLPRLLLSSGLSRTSLATMIDRLGQLGDSSVEKDKTYATLLESVTSNEWDIGRLGKRYSLALKLHSRLAAYTRLSSLQGESHGSFSTTFLNWLVSHCGTHLLRPRKSKQKKAQKSGTQSKLLPGSGKVSQMLTELYVMPVTEETGFEPFSFKAIHRPLFRPNKVKGHDDRSSAGIAEPSFDNTENTIKNVIESTDREVALVNATHMLCTRDTDNDQGITLACRWIPLLPLAANVPTFWTELFRASNNRQINEFLDILAKKCAVNWDRTQIQSCLEWIAASAIYTQLCLARMVYFVVANAGYGDVYLFRPSSLSAAIATRMFDDERVYRGLVELALQCGLSSSKVKRHSPWMILLRLLANSSPDRGRMVSDAVLQRMINANEIHLKTLRGTLLSLYVYCPSWVNVDVPSTQSSLVKAVNTFPDFVGWCAPTMDTALNNTLCSLATGSADGSVRSGRGLVEVARMYPLLLMKKLLALVSLLKADAQVVPHQSARDGRVFGEGLLDNREAILYDRTVFVKTRHWGYGYTETLWLALLDALLNVPSLLLFTCGASVGLLEILSIYLQLLSVQLRLRTPDRATRLKRKLSELLTSFRSTSPSGWKDWLGKVLEGSEIRHVLMSLELITPQDAIESIKADTDA
jgi:integrator complex subunit 1